MTDPLDNPSLPRWEPVEITNSVTAEEALAELARLRRDLIGHLETHLALIEKADRWKSEITEPLNSRIAEIEGFVARWWTAQVAANPSGPKSLTLPSGSVKSAVQPISVLVDDEAAFLAWAEEHAPGFINRPAPVVPDPKPAKSEIKSAIGEVLALLSEPDAEGARLVDKEGEVVPGIAVVRPDPKVTVST